MPIPLAPFGSGLPKVVLLMRVFPRSCLADFHLYLVMFVDFPNFWIMTGLIHATWSFLLSAPPSAMR